MNVNARVVEVIARIRSAGITVAAVGDRLRLIPKSRVTPEIVELARRHKPDLIAYLAPAPPADVVETQDGAFGELRQTLFRIDTMCEGRRRITLVRMGELIGDFGQVIGRLFVRGDYSAVPYACLDFERCAKALMQMDRYL